MPCRAAQHILITGACSAGKSTLGRALSRQLQLPVHRLDDDPDFRLLVEHELPECYRWTEPQRCARFHALRRQLVQEAIQLPQPHIIEGTHILVAPELTTAYRRTWSIRLYTRLSDKVWRVIAPSTPRTRSGTPRGMPARRALRQPGSMRPVPGRSTTACARRLRSSGTCLRSNWCPVGGSTPGWPRRDRPAWPDERHPRGERLDKRSPIV